MIINGSFEEPWGDDEPRESKLVFIGKNLDGASLADGFNACLATPSNMKKKADALRFAVGDHVECNMDGWLPGIVVAHMYRDDHMAPVSATQGSNQRPHCQPPCSQPPCRSSDVSASHCPALFLQGMVAPYQIKLDEDGDLIWAPSDCDSVIRSKHPPSLSSDGRPCSLT